MKAHHDAYPRGSARAGIAQQHRRFHRTLEQEAFVDRQFADVVEIVERHAALMLAEATKAAGTRTSALMQNAKLPIGDFDSSEPLAVVIAEGPERTAQQVWVEFGWEADREKRLLPNVRARLEFFPVARKGRARSSEVRLSAEYDPAPGSRHSPDAVLFGRRVVRAALVEFLSEVVRFVEDYEETLEMRLCFDAPLRTGLIAPRG